MAGPRTKDAILSRFACAVDAAYGQRVDRIVLYGSRARGEATNELDYDIAVFLCDMADRWTEMDKLAEISTTILYDTGEFIHAIPHAAGSYNERTPLMHEIRADGVDV